MVSEPPPLADDAHCLLRPPVLRRLSSQDAGGVLERRTTIGWYAYHFSLTGSQLHYFEALPQGRRGLLAGSLSLFHAKVSLASAAKRPREFDVTDAGGKVHVLRAATDGELAAWVGLCEAARHTVPPAKPIVAGGAEVGRHLKVDHVLCVVHGIGVDESTLETNTASLKESYREIMQRAFPDVEFSFELLVVHWRSALTRLDVHQKLHAVVPVAPEDNPLRQFMVHRIVDYVYYTHDRYRRHILREIATSLNQQVADFRQRRPEFNGRISIMGHSLGCVLCYDLLCRKVRDDQVLLEAEGMRLNFDVDNLFCLGNTLGTLVALDPSIGLSAGFERLPFRIYNVFKYHDPIATRLEPRLCLANAKVVPVTVPCWFNMGLRESTAQWLGTWWGKKEEGLSPGKSPRSTKSSAWQEKQHEWMEDLEDCGCGGEAFCGDRRMDFALQASSTMEDVSTSWSALKAHTEYWGNRDAMLFMITVMMKTTFGLTEDNDKPNNGAEAVTRIAGGLNGVVESVVEEILDDVVSRLAEDVPIENGNAEGEKGWASYLRGVWQG